MEGGKANRGKVENSNRIKDGYGRLALEEVEVRRIWEEYFEDLRNLHTHMCGFDRIRRGNYFGEEPIRRTEVEVRMKMLQVRMRSRER